MSAELATTGTSALAAMDRIINEVERRMVEIVGAKPRGYGENADGFPTFHHFAPGLYCREIRMPAGSVVTSYIHRHEHPYVVSAGECYVLNAECKWDHIVAPYFGITKAGTRRLLVMVRPTVWTTFHVTDTTDIEAVEREVFITPDNPQLQAREEAA